MIIRTNVVKGRGVASHFLSTHIDGIEDQFGIKLINGSLNLIGRHPIWLRNDKAFFVSGIHYFWHARILGYPVVINRWRFRCPVHTYEIFAGEHLRSKFSLLDGDPVDLEVEDALIDHENTSDLYKRILWYLLWGGRESLLYRNGLYRRIMYNHRTYWLVRHTFHDPALRQERDGTYTS